MQSIKPVFTTREVKPATPTPTVYAGAAPTTGEMSDFTDASRVPPNQISYWRARSLLGGVTGAATGDTLRIEVQPHCNMKYNIQAHRAWTQVDAAIGLRVRELGDGATLVDWWLTLWNRTETNSSYVAFRQQNPVLLRDRITVSPGNRYEISVKCRAGAGATGRSRGRQSWAVGSLFTRMSAIWYEFI